MLYYLKIHEHGHKSKRTERKKSCNLHRENMLIRKNKVYHYRVVEKKQK